MVLQEGGAGSVGHDTARTHKKAIKFLTWTFRVVFAESLLVPIVPL
jgi:hypothetical protein